MNKNNARKTPSPMTPHRRRPNNSNSNTNNNTNSFVQLITLPRSAKNSTSRPQPRRNTYKVIPNMLNYEPNVYYQARPPANRRRPQSATPSMSRKTYEKTFNLPKIAVQNMTRDQALKLFRNYSIAMSRGNKTLKEEMKRRNRTKN